MVKSYICRTVVPDAVEEFLNTMAKDGYALKEIFPHGRNIAESGEGRVVETIANFIIIMEAEAK